jgi:protein-disulfide isomerase
MWRSRISFMAAIGWAASLLIAGCSDRKCKSDEDCREGGKAPGRICYEGKCVSLEGGSGKAPVDNSRRTIDPNAVFKVPVDVKASPIKGPTHAPVTIVELSDFECPYCDKAAKTMKQIADAYPKAVRVVFMNNPLPFHKKADLAAEAAHEVFLQKGSEVFFRYHDKLFENRTSLERENLEAWAKELGVDPAKLKQALDARTHQKVVQAQEGMARSLGVSGAPAFYINGKFVNGAQEFAIFKQKVDEALEQAQKLIGSGVTVEQVYDRIIKAGKTAPVYLD